MSKFVVIGTIPVSLSYKIKGRDNYVSMQGIRVIDKSNLYIYDWNLADSIGLITSNRIENLGMDNDKIIWTKGASKRYATVREGFGTAYKSLRWDSNLAVYVENNTVVILYKFDNENAYVVSDCYGEVKTLTLDEIIDYSSSGLSVPNGRIMKRAPRRILPIKDDYDTITKSGLRRLNSSAKLKPIVRYINNFIARDHSVFNYELGIIEDGCRR
jgi:hypothetical protein